MELLRKRNIFRGEGKWVFGGGGGRWNKLFFGVSGNYRATPLNETVLCVDSPVYFFLLFWFGCGGFWLDIFEYLKVLYHEIANLLYTFRIPLQIFEMS